MIIHHSSIIPGFVVGAISSDEYDFWENYSNFQYKRFMELRENTIDSEQKKKYETLAQAFEQITFDIGDFRIDDALSFTIREVAVLELKAGLDLFKMDTQSKIEQLQALPEGINEDEISELKKHLEWIETYKNIDLYTGAGMKVTRVVITFEKL